MKIFGIAGWSGSGKTTLILRLLPVLVGRGIAVATLKHTHHDPALGDDDSRALIAAGLREAVIAAPERFAVMGGCVEPSLEDLARRVAGVDLLLVEGFKFSGHPKLEVWDPALGKPPLAPQQPSVVAVAADAAPPDCRRPVFRRDDAEAIAAFILAHGA